MIDHTNSRIEQQQEALRRENRRRYAFHRMLQATDRVLWRLEEMNRDGVRTVPKRVRAQIQKVVSTMPDELAEPLREGGQVQDMLDSLFEVQERLFRWRYPDWQDFDPDGDEYSFVAS
jgi:hypothetical protein